MHNPIGLALAQGDRYRATPKQHHKALEPTLIETPLPQMPTASPMPHKNKSLRVQQPPELLKTRLPAHNALPLTELLPELVEAGLGVGQVIGGVDQVLGVVDVEHLAAVAPRRLGC